MKLSSDRSGLTLLSILLNAAIIGVLIVVGLLLLFAERARTRDAIRIADMAKVRMGFELMFFERNSFADAAAGCGAADALVSACALADYLPDVAAIQDPGRFRYAVTRVPDAEDFGIAFTLEKRRGALAAGRHVLTHAGVQ